MATPDDLRSVRGLTMYPIPGLREFALEGSLATDPMPLSLVRVLLYQAFEAGATQEAAREYRIATKAPADG